MTFGSFLNPNKVMESEAGKIKHILNHQPTRSTLKNVCIRIKQIKLLLGFHHPPKIYLNLNLFYNFD